MITTDVSGVSWLSCLSDANNDVYGRLIHEFQQELHGLFAGLLFYAQARADKNKFPANGLFEVRNRNVYQAYGFFFCASGWACDAGYRRGIITAEYPSASLCHFLRGLSAHGAVFCQRSFPYPE